ncbi:thioesterase domain-containing protein [Roseovarius rhodophyticola]|uniref:Thioesterase domain-containing protein n=1 Tax=Roseovarius rhodophyticola TaxID=3080827 RepID=A0ABZ2TGF2_9RHOB|nr:thioesterase domain-containing protein [Roseovarius sp. W115]MDV2928991.1 thioesterase domain-containing protein [Roseovarius sp. W115]
MNAQTGLEGMKLLTLQPKATGVPFVFTPDLGGNLLYSRDLVPRLPSGLAPYGLSLTENALGALDSLKIESLAADFAEYLRNRWPDGALHLAGFSFAGVLAFETARMLTNRNRPVSHIWLFDTRVHRLHMPSAIFRSPVLEMKCLLVHAAKSIFKRPSDPDTMLRSYRLLEIDLKQRPKAYWPTIRALHKALENYRPDPFDKTPVTLFRTKEPNPLLARPRHLGWDRLTPDKLRVVDVDAEHLTIMHTAASLETITDCLSQAVNSG